MIFLSAAEPNVSLTVYGTHFSLQPLTFPDVRVDQILAMEDELGRRILQKNDGKLQKVSFDAQRLPGFPKPYDPSSSMESGSRVLIIRGGGIGDVLMCTPAIKALRRRLPEDVHLTISTFGSNRMLFTGNPHLVSVIPQPMTLAQVMHADYYVEFKDPKGLISRMHMIDFYLQGMGIDPHGTADKRPVLSLESLWNADVSDSVRRIGKNYRQTIYLNGLASDPLRDLPVDILSLFPENFPDRVFIVSNGYKSRYAKRHRRLFSLPNVFCLDTEDSLAGYVTALSACDGIITTDSSAYHIGAALEKPCLTLFGPIASGLRTTYYPTVQVMEAVYSGKTCRSPCGKSMFSEFNTVASARKQKCPEADEKGTDFSPCLGSFETADLVNAFNRTLNGPSSGKITALSHEYAL